MSAIEFKRQPAATSRDHTGMKMRYSRDPRQWQILDLTNATKQPDNTNRRNDIRGWLRNLRAKSMRDTQLHSFDQDLYAKGGDKKHQLHASSSSILMETETSHFPARPKTLQYYKSALDLRGTDSVLSTQAGMMRSMESSHATSGSTKKKKKRAMVFNYNKPAPPEPDDNQTEGPGPNAYSVMNETIAERLRTRLGVTFKGRHSTETHREKSPGPGAYDIKAAEETSLKGRGYSISKSKRGELDPNLVAVPGVGAYTLDKPFHTAGTVIFGKSVSTEIGRRTDRVDMDVPGPGKYNTVTKQVFGPKFTFGKSNRFSSWSENNGLDEVGACPGPLTYKPNFEVTLPHCPVVKIGTEPKFMTLVDDEVPGAGKYAVKLDGLDRRGVKFSKQRRFIRKVGQVANF